MSTESELKKELRWLHGEIVDVFGALDLIGGRLVLDAPDAETANAGSTVTILAKHLRREANELNNLFLKMQ